MDLVYNTSVNNEENPIMNNNINDSKVKEARKTIDELANMVTRVHATPSSKKVLGTVKGYLGKGQYKGFANAAAVLFCKENGLSASDIPSVAWLFEETLLASGVYHTVKEWNESIYPYAEVVDYEPEATNEYGEDVNSVKLADGRYAVL